MRRKEQGKGKETQGLERGGKVGRRRNEGYFRLVRHS